MKMRMLQRRWGLPAVLCIISIILLSGCGNSYGGSSYSSNSSSAAEKQTGGKYTIMERNSGKLGNYLVDAKGMTLYYYTKDTPGKSNCSGGCLKAWPAFHTDTVHVPNGLASSDFGEITRMDGSKQTTYKGYPLYYYFQDQNAGDVTGQDVNDVWYVVNPDSFQGSSKEEDGGNDKASY